jgi:predicted RNA binding protein YcfA (HicA-like mRNA interferase family)
MKIKANNRLIMKYANYIGFTKVRQRGSHMILKNNDNHTATLKHSAGNKTFSQYHLKNVLQDFGSSLNEYMNYLNIK